MLLNVIIDMQQDSVRERQGTALIDSLPCLQQGCNWSCCLHGYM
jgi:hypothetical protein